MQKCVIRLLVVLFTAQLCVGDIHAGTKGQDDICTTSSECISGLRCIYSAVGNTCQPCTNGPADQNNKACGEDGSMCQYTSYGDSSGKCPWNMYCVVPYYPNTTQQKCVQCGANQILNIYQEEGTDDDCYAIQYAWINQGCGELFQYTCNDEDLETSWAPRNHFDPNIAYECIMSHDLVPQITSLVYASGKVTKNSDSLQCVNKKYPVELYGNYESDYGPWVDTVYKTYNGDWTDVTGATITSVNIPRHPELKKFLGYWTTRTGGTTVINERGVPQDNAEITGETTLYAHWGDYIPYNIYFTHPDETMNPYYVTCTTGPVCNLYEKDANDACHSMQYSMCDLHESCGNDEDGQKMQLNITSGYGSLSSDGKTITLGDVAKNEIYNNMNFTTGASSVTVGSVTLSECTAGYYCNMCVETKCPYGSTSTAGASATSDCYLDPANLQFKDSTGKTFSLPISDSKLKILLK